MEREPPRRAEDGDEPQDHKPMQKTSTGEFKELPKLVLQQLEVTLVWRRTPYDSTVVFCA